jgi:hypothetical protein
MPTFVETYRATVAPADCDHLGHMNVCVLSTWRGARQFQSTSARPLRN